MAAKPPMLSHILETVLYARNLDKAREFYGSTLGLKPIAGVESDRMIGYELGHTNLLIFALGKTRKDAVMDSSEPDHRIPKHGPSQVLLDTLLDDTKKPADAQLHSLRQHYCFAAESVEDVKKWEEYVMAKSIHITGRMDWPQGGYSFYFADPDGHVGEIASRGLWPNWK